jgi:hypothetical protein
VARSPQSRTKAGPALGLVSAGSAERHDRSSPRATSLPAGPWVLVVGMHRSGTSAVTGALGDLGLAVPVAWDRWQTTEDNPDHWESVALGLHDDALLERLGGAWDRPPELGSGWQLDPDLADGQLADPAVAANAAFPDPGPVVWKDPRICLLLPYWLARLPGPVAAIFLWRDPLSVARSLQARDGFTLDGGVALWEWYNHAALTGLRGVDTFVARYESIVADPRGSLGELVGWLGGLPQLSAHAAHWDLDAACTGISADLEHQRDDGDADLLLDEHRALLRHLASLGGPHRPFTASPPGEVSSWTTALLAERRHAVALVRQREALADALAEHAEQAAAPAAWRVPPRGTLAELHYLNAKKAGNGTSRSSRLTRPFRRLVRMTSWRTGPPFP